MTKQEFTDGWEHFCSRVDFRHSGLDAEAIRFMNEMPATVRAALPELDVSGETKTTESKQE